ncbi:MAG: TIGR00282 family metallophosphoesterase [Rhodobiaceae bacterium]|nr:TIGR00282 family metallophosphoesterase [Rhodobiaceae bacterium]MCC0013115.1 TIGR00282 family metallophosphoesterase [Rhodobiaceae bacterium]MCC0018505.1 TIGR00282 family metallophosphoesterase [Rhodobiaceae bacterium]
MRILFIGDVIGRAGRKAVMKTLPELIERYRFEFVVVNGENSAGGFGITEAIHNDFCDAGADVVTLGNHSFDQREALVFITRTPNLIRPINYPQGTPGAGAGLFETRSGKRVLVINVLGRLFMQPLDDPFAAVEKAVSECPLGDVADAIIIDMHAEATSEKQGIAHFLDGRVSLVVGTHTHVPTADHQILAGGTAYQTDAGMTGDFDSIIGMDKEEPVNRFLTALPRARFEPAMGEATVCGLAVELDRRGLATDVAPIRIGGRLSQSLPDWD